MPRSSPFTPRYEGHQTGAIHPNSQTRGGVLPKRRSGDAEMWCRVTPDNDRTPSRLGLTYRIRSATCRVYWHAMQRARAPRLAHAPGPGPCTRCVDLNEPTLFERDVVLRKDRGDRADRLAGCAVDALVRVDIELAVDLFEMDAVDRTYVKSPRWPRRHRRTPPKRRSLGLWALFLDPAAAPGRYRRPALHLGTVGFDEAAHLGSRGSSSRAKKAEAALRISLARRSSLFSRSRVCSR